MRCFLLQDIRRKFRRQTSDNMDRWKAEMGRVSEKRRIEERRSEKRKSRRKKMQMREKVGKSRNTVFFQWFVAPEGRKVGSLKRRVRSHLARWEMEKLHAVVARSTFASEKAKNTSRSEHFWKLRSRKKCTPWWREAHFEVKMYKTHQGFGPLLKVAMSKKCTPLWREAHFEAKRLKTPGVRTTFGRSDVVSRGRRKGLCTFSKVSKTWGFCSMSKNKGRRGTFEEDLQRCISRGRRSTRDMFIRDVRRSGRWFPEGLHFGASDL